ncbi:MAG: hypothetical protein KC418_17810 [Anaerolineales bacterium]|nr:hypothetical protein [Anaerolineales bacterium]MCB8950644.1 hypothetical protein [Ardenticatenales bacterium]
MENSRSGRVNAPLTALLVVLLVGVNARDTAVMFPPEQVPKVYGSLALYIPLITMPFYASAVLNNAIQSERTRGSIVPLLNFGGNPVNVWMGKLLATFILSYGVMLIGLIAYVGYIGLYEKQAILIDGPGFFNMLVTMPLVALLLIAVQAFIYWTFKSSTLLAVLIPITIMFGGAELLSRVEVKTPPFFWALVGVVLSICLVGILAVFVSRVPKSKVAGLL